MSTRLHPKDEAAIDTIDAAIFSGDTFIHRGNIAHLREQMARWERGLKEHEETLAEIEKS